MLNLLSGSVTVENRKLPILWTGMYALHITTEHLDHPSTHPVLHVEAQQLLQQAQVFKVKKIWAGFNEQSNGTFFIPLKLYTQFAVIKTCYIMGLDMENAKKQKGVKGANSQGWISITNPIEELQEFVDLGDFDSVEEAKYYIEKALNKIAQKKRNSKKR